MNRKEYDIFISYSSNDQKVVEALWSYLEMKKLRCFVAYNDVPKGKDWGSYIVKAIADCKLFIYIHSQSANESEETTREINLAFKKRCIVIPFRIDSSEYIPAKEYRLTNVNWLDAFPDKPDNYFEALYEMIKSNIPDRIKDEDKEEECDILFKCRSVEFSMVKVVGGTFRRGETSGLFGRFLGDKKPEQLVKLSDYYIGQTQVTQELWETVMGNNPSRFTGNNKHPVEKVSWNDCQEFIQKLNELTGKQFRLPTEAEWEFAARGGNKSKGYRYSGSNDASTVAWHKNNSENKTHPVALKQVNELGLYDMSGNVWEWCQDLYGDYSSTPQINPKGASDGVDHVIRGGSWYYEAKLARVSSRNDSSPINRFSDIGFRLAL